MPCQPKRSPIRFKIRPSDFLWRCVTQLPVLRPFWFAGLQHNPAGLLLLKVAGPVAIAWLVPSKLLVPSIALLFGVVGWNLAELTFA